MLSRSLLNSALYTSLGTAANMLMTTTMAHALSTPHLLFRGFFQILVVATFFFGGGLIPSFLVVRGLGMYNRIWPLVFPAAISTWNLVVPRTFFQTLPRSWRTLSTWTGQRFQVRTLGVIGLWDRCSGTA